jgi:recombinase
MQQQIRLILSHPKYTGCVVFNRTSAKLKSKVKSNPREQWVVRSGVFPAIVPQDVFDRAQRKLANSVFRRSNERLLSELRTYIETHGKPCGGDGPKPAGMASMSTYRYRFGGRNRRGCTYKL